MFTLLIFSSLCCNSYSTVCLRYLEIFDVSGLFAVSGLQVTGFYTQCKAASRVKHILPQIPCDLTPGSLADFFLLTLVR